MSSKISTTSHTIIFLATISYFLIISLYRIKSPGLHYDEVLFVNAALGGNSEHFIHKRLFGFPLMLMPYIGALKAYIYNPIFHFFGVSPATIRIPAILISLSTILLSYKTVKLVSSKWFGLVAAILIATDTTFIFVSKVDFGPISSMLFLKTASIYLVVKIATSPSKEKKTLVYFQTLVVLSVIGIFDKLNFIWFSLSLISLLPLLYSNEIKKIFAMV